MKKTLFPEDWPMTRVAKALGVTPSHLYKVIGGKRTSQKLMDKILKHCPRILENQ